MNDDRATLKREVREALRGCMPGPVWATLLYRLLVGAGGLLLPLGGLLLSGGQRMLAELAMAWIRWGGDLETMVEQWMGQWMLQNLGAAVGMVLGLWVGILLSAVWSSLLMACYRRYCLALVRGEAPGVGVLLGGLRRWPALLGIQILMALHWLLVYVLLLVMGGVALYYTQQEWVVLPIAVLLVAALLWIALRYAFAQHLIADHPRLGPLGAMKGSAALLRGRKGSLLLLYLSFWGWAILIGVVSSLCTMGGSEGVAALILQQLTQGRTGVGGVVMALLPMLAGTLVQLVGDLFLQPYIYGSEARLYDLLQREQEGEPAVLSAPAGGEPPRSGSGPERPRYE